MKHINKLTFISLVFPFFATRAGRVHSAFCTNCLASRCAKLNLSKLVLHRFPSLYFFLRKIALQLQNSSGVHTPKSRQNKTHKNRFHPVTAPHKTEKGWAHRTHMTRRKAKPFVLCSTPVAIKLMTCIIYIFSNN